MSPGAILVAGLAVTVGSILQGSVGFGLGMVAAPVLAFLERLIIRLDLKCPMSSFLSTPRA